MNEQRPPLTLDEVKSWAWSTAIRSRRLERAVEIAVSAHSGQIDKGHQPYILHPLRLMVGFGSDLEAATVAVLHDVVEDSRDWQLSDLDEEGFGDSIMQALDAITRRDGETYMDFIKRCGENDLAKRVKLADLVDNMNMDRIPVPLPEDFERLKRYQKADKYLRSQP